MQEKPSSPEKIFNLDNQAKKLGIGGKLSPDSDESSYKKECRKEKIFKPKDCKLEKQKKVY